MSHQKYKGKCHCGNISLEMSLADTPGNYVPRTCDCSFCIRHSDSYISDPAGSLKLRIKNRDYMTFYRQGSETADFLLCSVCAVLVAVIYEDHDKLYAAVNLGVLEGPSQFGHPTVGSPWKLNDREKVQRWRSLCFPDVEINYNGI